MKKKYKLRKEIKLILIIIGLYLILLGYLMFCSYRIEQIEKNEVVEVSK